MKKIMCIILTIAMTAMLMPLIAVGNTERPRPTEPEQTTPTLPTRPGSEIPNEPTAPPREQIVLPTTRAQSAQLDRFGNGLALVLGNPVAFANGRLALIDGENQNVVPLVVDGRTLVPVRFIAESYGADVGWDDDTQSVTITMPGANIALQIDSDEMTVNGNVITLDVPAQTMEGRTMIPFRAFAEAIGKQVFWDDRGLILITDNEVDEVADVRMISAVFGYIRTFKTNEVINMAPNFTDTALEWAFNAQLTSFVNNTHHLYPHSGNLAWEVGGTLAMFYLAYAAYTNPNARSSRGVLASDRALLHIRNIISGGTEFRFDSGPLAATALLPNAIVMLRHTPVIWDQLTEDEISRIDLLMEAGAIIANWGFNDANNYFTGFGMEGNFNKMWNPNFRAKAMIAIVAAVMYFGSAEAVNDILVNFDYDDFFRRLEEANFTNIINRWSPMDRNIMMRGGPIQQQVHLAPAGAGGGTGRGVRVPFVWTGLPLSDVEGIVYRFITAQEGPGMPAGTYSRIVQDGWTRGNTSTYTLGDASSPFVGEMGAFFEFYSNDASGMRSDAAYGYASMQVVVPFIINLNLFYDGWDGSTPRQQSAHRHVYVGNEDLLFKLHYGFMSWSHANARLDYGHRSLGNGFLIVKDMWRVGFTFSTEPTTVANRPMGREQ